MRYSERLHQRGVRFDEYMRREALSETRHELVDGDVYAMVGGTRRHARIALNVSARLRAAARGTGCEVYQEGVKIRAEENTVYYPDVVVACDPTDNDELIINRPCLIVEVTSPSSKRIDRREKLGAYTALPSLRAYLIVEQHRRRVTVHLREAGGDWSATDLLEEADTIRIPCLDTTLSVAEVYEDVVLPPLGVAEAEAMQQDFVPVEW